MGLCARGKEITVIYSKAGLSERKGVGGLKGPNYISTPPGHTAILRASGRITNQRGLILIW